MRRMGLRGWPESSPSGGADSAEMWEGEEGMSIWAEASGRVAEGVRTDWRRSVGQLEMFEDGEDDGWVSAEGENVHLATTGGTQQRQHLVDPREQNRPQVRRHTSSSYCRNQGSDHLGSGRDTD